MKTPLQELHHWVSTELKLDGYEHRVILDKIESLLEKESLDDFVGRREHLNCGDCKPMEYDGNYN